MDNTQNSPSWWQRNRKWAGPTGCLAIVTVFVALIIGLIAAVFGAIRLSDPSETALASAMANPDVVAAIGDPMEIGWFVSGNISVDGSSGEADLSVPVSGPRGSCTVYVIGEKSAGKWNYSVLEADCDGVSERINLDPSTP